VGLGVSAVGAIGPTYSQNLHALGTYYERLDRWELPIARGIGLTADDLVRRAIVQALMCHFAVSSEAVGLAYLIDFERYFAPELEDLRDLESLGVVSCEHGWINVTAKGRPYIRAVCMIFDRYLRQGSSAQRYSRVI
jgi:oxygen-independent coproporphyrinogen-3 oxidase